MQVQNINLIGLNSDRSLGANKTKSSYTKSIQKDSVSFAGYQETLAEYAEKSIKDTQKLQEAFKKLFEETAKDRSIQKLAGFNQIKSVYEQSGFNGLLKKLMSAEMGNELQSIVPKKNMDTIVLAKQGPNPILLVKNAGKYRILDVFQESSKSPTIMQIKFINPDKTKGMTFSISRRGRKYLESLNDNILTQFKYFRTGKLKRKMVENKNYSDTTYYKKDGSVNLFLTLLLGGKFTV